MSYSETVNRINDYISRRDWEALKPYLAEDVVFHVPGRNAVAGVYHGVGQVLGLCAVMAARLDPLERNSRLVRAWSDTERYIGVIERRATAAGVPVQWVEKNAYFFRDGQLLAFWIFVDNVQGFNSYWAVRSSSPSVQETPPAHLASLLTDLPSQLTGA